MIFLIANIAAGAASLLAGRRLFWLFVAITGFFVGAEVAGDLFANQSQWVVWVLAAGSGIIGAVLAMLLQRIAFDCCRFWPSAAPGRAYWRCACGGGNIRTSDIHTPKETFHQMNLTFWSFSRHLAVNSLFYVEFKSESHQRKNQNKEVFIFLT